MRRFAFDLSTRAKLRVSGPDRARYLNGQITNDLAKATAAAAVHAVVLNAKGRMQADVFIHADEAAYIIDADPELRGSIGERLERYVVADDVEIADVTDDFGLVHVLGEPAGPFSNGARAVAAKRFGVPGVDLWLTPNRTAAVLEELAADYELLDDARRETFRIEQGVPRWGAELSDAIIAVEAGLEADVIDYEKGCYIGQEVISRMKMSGQKNKELRGFVSLTGAPLHTGMRLFANATSGAEIGWLTSATRSDALGQEIALGFAKRGHNALGTELCAADSSDTNSVAVRIVELPFAAGVG